MKKLLTILFAVALGLNLSAQVPDYVPTDGLVAWYPFDSSIEDESVNSFNLCTNSISYTDGRHGDVGGAFLGVYGGDLLTFLLAPMIHGQTRFRMLCGSNHLISSRILIQAVGLP